MLGEGVNFIGDGKFKPFLDFSLEFIDLILILLLVSLAGGRFRWFTVHAMPAVEERDLFL